MCKFSSKSGGVPFQPLGDLTWNDPSCMYCDHTFPFRHDIHTNDTYITTCMRSYMHTYMVTCCDNYCEVINLHVHVCVVLTLFKRINSDAVRIILLCFSKFYICAYSSPL